MSFIPPSSSLPVLSSSLLVGSSKSHLQGFHPQIPKLPYRTVNFVTFEPSVLKTYQLNNDIFCPSLSIALSDGLNTLLQAAYNKTEYNKKFEEEDTTKTATKSDANRAFLEKDLNSKLSKSEITSFDLNNSKDTKFPTNLSLDTIPGSNKN